MSTSASVRDSGSFLSSATSITTASSPIITSDPFCVPCQNHEEGDGGKGDCNGLHLCECTSGTISGTYTAMSGTSQCGYTKLPSLIWDGQVHCTTDTIYPVIGSDITVHGCTATSTTNEVTVHVSSRPPLATCFPTNKTPTGGRHLLWPKLPRPKRLPRRNRIDSKIGGEDLPADCRRGYIRLT